MSTLSPAAEYVLTVGLDRAVDMIRAGHIDDARRALTNAQDAANLIDIAERARIVEAGFDATDDGRDREDLRTSE